MVCFAPGRDARAGYAAIVIDASSGEVLDEVNADQINHPASLTKLMTLYLAFEALQKGRLQWDQPLQVSEWAANKSPTRLGLQPGSTLDTRDCVLAMIVLSANDAATVMAEALGGSEDRFAELMTAKAHELGMSSTSFVNASGLPDEDQVTTARDLVKLSMAIYRDFPQDYHYFSTRQFLFRGRVVAGHNRLMYRYAGMDGLKTGFTVASGFNLASSAVRDDRRLFGVVMGSESAPARDRLMATLLDNGFAHQPTDPILVAEAAGESPRAAHRMLAGAERVLAALSPIEKAEAAPAPVARPAAPPTESRPRWSVQVGAFTRQGQAEQAAAAAVKLAGLAGHTVEVTPPARGERIYRARLEGFGSERQARNACQILRAKGHICVVVTPAGASLRLARID
jgi:D-alanyl-D-alanine carboxypeptidase